MMDPNSSEVKIVRLTAADVGVVSDLLCDFLNELADGKSHTLEELQPVARHLIEEKLIIGAIAYIDHEPAGLILLNECAAIYAGGCFGEITELYVVPKYRSHGVAVHLISEAKLIAQERSWKRFEVGAPDQPAWERTLKFYLREGFEEVGPRLRLLL